MGLGVYDGGDADPAGKGMAAVVTRGWLLVSLAAFGFVSTLLLVPRARRVALLYGITDDPNERKLHSKPTPYLGGVAIALVGLAGSVFLENWSVQGAAIILGAVLVSIVGLVDDVRTVRPAARIGIEAGAAFIAALAGARVHLGAGPFDWVLTVVALVLITNAFNLLDNMDGAAGIIATVTAAALAMAAGLQGQWLVGGLGALVAGSCLGFLRYNWHPASIFMGDAGSLFLGFILGSVALKLRFPVGHGASLPAIGLLLGPALFDTTLVVVARLRSHRPIYLGATDHTSHRLLRLGMSTRSVAVVLALSGVVLTTAGVAVGRGWAAPVALLPPVIVAATAALFWLLHMPDQDAGESTESDARVGRTTDFVSS